MEMILNENDLVVGARFENGTIQDYIDENKNLWTCKNWRFNCKLVFIQ